VIPISLAGYAKHIVRKTQDEIQKKLEDYPPQPLPHLQPVPHPQFPPQHDIFQELKIDAKTDFGYLRENNKIKPCRTSFQGRPMTPFIT
jgi:hypothetical protein